MSVGQIIAAARTARGLSIEDVARETRIRVSQLQALESDAFDPAEAVVFLRLRIRTVASALGIDEAQILQVFEEQTGSTPVVASVQMAVADNLNIFDFEKKEALPPRRNYAIPLIVSGVVLLALAIWFSRAVLMQSAAPLPLPSVTLSASAQETTTPAESPTAADPALVSMQLSATAASWIQVKASNGEVLLETTLQPGDSLAFVDNTELVVRVGNAGGVDFEVNGVRLGPLGNTGEVVDRVFTLGDPSVAE